MRVEQGSRRLLQVTNAHPTTQTTRTRKHKHAEPLSVYVDTYGTGAAPDADIARAVSRTFDFRPGRIIEALGLRSVPLGGSRYADTAAYGHFGRKDGGGVFTWEETRPIKL